MANFKQQIFLKIMFYITLSTHHGVYTIKTSSLIIENEECFKLKDGDRILKNRILRIATTKLKPRLIVPNEIRSKIKPSDINLSRGLSNSKWRNCESESSAHWLVKLAQKNKSWRNFTKKEIDDCCKHDFHFNYTINYGDIVVNMDETYSFTDSFINEVYDLTT